MTNPRKDRKEERAIAILLEIVEMDRQDRDALPGSVVKLVKKAITIMRKRRPPINGRRINPEERIGR